LPFNLGVGVVFDVHRFLVPHTPVPETAVCLALDIPIVSDLDMMRLAPFEMGMVGEQCLYWTNTDSEGVARFYTPLPLQYELISFHSPRFIERTRETVLLDGTVIPSGGASRAPPYYPSIKDSVSIPLPLNRDLASVLESDDDGLVTLDDPDDDPRNPVYIDADLPYPLAEVHVQRSYPVAISIHWRYRDNVQVTDIAPLPSVLAPEFLDILLSATNPLTNALGATPAGGLLASSPDQVHALLGTASDPAKAVPAGAIPMSEQVLGVPLAQALPISLQNDPNACQWGYGHEISPQLDPRTLIGLVDDLLDQIGRLAPTDPLREQLQDLVERILNPVNGGKVVDDILSAPERDDITADSIRKAVQQLKGAEAEPDTLVMRMAPLLSRITGITTNIPVCTAVYPFNIPQPNEDSFWVVEFDLKLENTLLIVCAQVALAPDCFVIVPGPGGIGNIVVPVGLSGLDPMMGGMDRTGMSLRRGELPSDPAGEASPLPGLPDPGQLLQKQHISLFFEQYTKDFDHGTITYTAIPLDLGLTGLLDPILGILEQNGVAVQELLRKAAVDAGLVSGENHPLNVTLDMADLVRKTIGDQLELTSYVEISRPVFLFDTWWWDDSFFDARVLPTELLPRTTPETLGTAEGSFDIGEDFWWLTRPNLNRAYFDETVKYLDPDTLQPDLGRMRKDGYKWNQPEFFESVMQVWDDEHSVDASMNQVHFHGADPRHEFVQTAQHCTREQPPAAPGSQVCLEGLLAYEEGDGWFLHDDVDGDGVFDPDLGLFTVKINCLLCLLDGAFGFVAGANQLVWTAGPGSGVFGGAPVPLGDWFRDGHKPAGGNVAQNLVENSLGWDMRDLLWWDRDGAPTANRAVYSDLVTTTAFFLATHHKTCEEMYDLPGQAPFFLDANLRWKTTCPWDPAVREPDTSGDPSDSKFLHGATRDGWVREEGRAAEPGTAWYRHRGKFCETPQWEAWHKVRMGEGDLRILAVPSDADVIRDFYTAHGETVLDVDVEREPFPYTRYCGNHDGRIHYILVAETASQPFNGGAKQYANQFSKVLHPVWHDGTFGVDPTAWSCDAADGCAWAQTPMERLWSHLKQAVPGIDVPHVLPTATGPVSITIGQFFGVDASLYRDELHFTVPGEDWAWYTDPRFGDLGLDRREAPTGTPGPWRTFQEAIRTTAPLLASAVADAREGGRPIFTPVEGKVPFEVLTKVRPSTDGKGHPVLLTPEGTAFGVTAPGDKALFACDGAFWGGECHRREAVFDAGDLSFLGQGGWYGRQAKAKDTHIPQGSAYARFNDQHLVVDRRPLAAAFQQVADSSAEAAAAPGQAGGVTCEYLLGSMCPAPSSGASAADCPAPVAPPAGGLVGDTVATADALCGVAAGAVKLPGPSEPRPQCGTPDGRTWYVLDRASVGGYSSHGFRPATSSDQVPSSVRYPFGWDEGSVASIPETERKWWVLEGKHCERPVFEEWAEDFLIRYVYHDFDAAGKAQAKPQSDPAAQAFLVLDYYTMEGFARDTAAPGSPDVHATRDLASGVDRTVCWFDPTWTHSPNPHKEFDRFRNLFGKSPTDAGRFRHVEGGGAPEEPVPMYPVGSWCRNDAGSIVPARTQREYVPMRLHMQMMEGDLGTTRLPAITPYDGAFAAAGKDKSMGGLDLPGVVLAILQEVLGLGDRILGAPIGGIGTGVDLGQGGILDVTGFVLERDAVTGAVTAVPSSDPLAALGPREGVVAAATRLAAIEQAALEAEVAKQVAATLQQSLTSAQRQAVEAALGGPLSQASYQGLLGAPAKLSPNAPELAIALSRLVPPAVAAGAPTVPVLTVTVPEDVQFLDAIVHHRHSLPEGTAGAFVATTSADLADARWSLLSGRGTPATVSATPAPQQGIAVLDLSPWRGQTVTIGMRILDETTTEAWRGALWDVLSIELLPTLVPTTGPKVSGYGGPLAGA
ncbi:MAG TPA: hypothetical protein VFH47_00190, partial [Candidatus Thermoplasmatota archaeon]|nr:hypothetical protein [Candidatus Thermoplasmatota archaeon]